MRTLLSEMYLIRSNESLKWVFALLCKLHLYAFKLLQNEFTFMEKNDIHMNCYASNTLF